MLANVLESRTLGVIVLGRKFKIKALSFDFGQECRHLSGTGQPGLGWDRAVATLWPKGKGGIGVGPSHEEQSFLTV